MNLIEIQNDQNEVLGDFNDLIIKVINKCIELEEVKKDCQVDVMLVNNEQIREINFNQRSIDKETDVLSFPMVSFVNGELIDDTGDYDGEALFLGDLIISLERALEQSIEYNHSFQRELAFLVSHGVYHLLGYDHMDEKTEKEMISKQEVVLSKFELMR